MLKVVAFMKQVAEELRMGGNFGTAHVYRSSINAIIAYHGEGDFSFDEVTPEWLKGFEVHLRGRGCSWNTVSTYLRTFRAVYNRAVNSRMVIYTPHLFRSVYTGTRADHKRALCDEDMKKVFTKLPQSSAVPSAIRCAQDLFVLMFLLRGLPFVDLAYLRKSDLRDNVITYRRRKTGETFVGDAYSGSDGTIKEVYEPRPSFALSLPAVEKWRRNEGGLPGISVGIAQLQPATHASWAKYWG